MAEAIKAVWGQKSFHYSRGQWASVFDRFVKTFGQARSFLYVNSSCLFLFSIKAVPPFFFYSVSKKRLTFSSDRSPLLIMPIYIGRYSNHWIVNKLSLVNIFGDTDCFITEITCWIVNFVKYVNFSLVNSNFGFFLLF